MTFNAGCWRRRLAALVIVMSLPGGCATVSSEPVVGGCPAVVEYSQAEQIQVADEIESLSGDAVLADWLADYSVLREQARACGA